MNETETRAKACKRVWLPQRSGKECTGIQQSV